MLVLLVIVLVTIWKVGETFCFPRFAVHSQRECLQSSFSTRFRSSFHPLFARPRLGDTVVAEVDDIGGSMKEPKVFFNVLCLYCSDPDCCFNIYT